MDYGRGALTLFLITVAIKSKCRYNVFNIKALHMVKNHGVQAVELGITTAIRKDDDLCKNANL